MIIKKNYLQSEWLLETAPLFLVGKMRFFINLRFRRMSDGKGKISRRKALIYSILNFSIKNWVFFEELNCIK
jgi:hypothetical protein